MAERLSRGPGGVARQAAELRKEGVHVISQKEHLGGLMVDFSIYGWFPDILPTEEAEQSDEEEETEI